ncbi:MAG: ATP-dependent DNA helicase [Eubacteriales bacterium]
MPSTISEMYKLKLTSKQVPSLMKDILKYRNKKLLNHNTLLTVHSEFFRLLNKNKDSTLELSMSDSVLSTIMKLLAHLELARVSVEQYRDGTRPIPPHIIRELSDIMEFLGYLSKENEWIVTFDRKQEVIQILPKKLLDLLYEDFWSNSIPMILTSGTLSVGGDFGYFKAQIGLSKPNHKLTQFTVNSPFDYQNHGILYLPTDIPYHDIGNKEYILDVANRVSDLLKATHGHSLVLFTSYRLMEQVLRFVERKVVDFPFFVAQKGGENVLSDYRKSENGVLFATDTMGEGIDLAGDLLSSVIVVKLPFPIPNPLSNYEYQKSDSYEDFSENFVIPAMITKLRQWIGRGIRTESDTCVFSILDARANKKYKDEILKSLPAMPVTDKLEDVKKFIAEKKGSDYFDKHN